MAGKVADFLNSLAAYMYKPTSGQQCWQLFVSAQHSEGPRGGYCRDSALLHWKLGLPGVWQQGEARWGREMNGEQMSGFLAVYVYASLRDKVLTPPTPPPSTKESRRMVYTF